MITKLKFCTNRRFYLSSDIIKNWGLQQSICQLILIAITYNTIFSEDAIEQEFSECNFFIFCIYGQGVAIVNGETFTILPNTYFLVPTGCYYSMRPNENDPWETCQLFFKGTLADLLTTELLTHVQAGNNFIIDKKQAVDKFSEVGNAVRSYKHNQDCVDIYFKLHSFLSLFFLPSPTKINRDEIEIVEKVTQYLRLNIQNTLSLNDIASAFKIPVHKLTTVFKNGTGQTPIEHFNLLKVKKACHLLLTSNLRINEIGREVGINDALYFSRLFHSVSGISPKEYRHGYKEIA